MSARHAPCACEAQKKGALSRDPEAKAAIARRLSRAVGQLKGVARMVEDDRYCPEVLTQVSAVQEALRSISQELLRAHLSNCAQTALREGGEQADEMVAELTELFARHLR